MGQHSGRVGTATSLRNAKDAGVTYWVPKWLRKKARAIRQQHRAWQQALDARPAVDMRPRLVKPDGKV